MGARNPDAASTTAATRAHRAVTPLRAAAITAPAQTKAQPAASATAHAENRLPEAVSDIMTDHRGQYQSAPARPHPPMACDLSRLGVHCHPWPLELHAVQMAAHPR
jgi:hypothetical protein